MSQLVLYSDLDSYIPERAPVRMVDRLLLEPEVRRASGARNLSINEAFFQGHFPGSPILPGVLQVAAMSQVGGALLRELLGNPEAVFPALVGIRRLKFRNPAFPGDRIRVEVELAEGIEPDAEGTAMKAVVRRDDGTVISQGAVTVALREHESLGALSREFMPARIKLDGIPENIEESSGMAVDLEGLMELIPHRFPFLLVERLPYLSVEEQRAVGLKNVTGNEIFFAGQPFPELPAYLLPEIAAQAGCALALCVPEHRGKLAYFMAIDEARFLAPVIPGDQLVIDVHTNARGRFGKADVTVYVGNRIVAETGLKFAVVDHEA
jgi:3-hydroxyacyl-[acyl-carrier-protein] dehydratase